MPGNALLLALVKSRKSNVMVLTVSIYCSTFKNPNSNIMRKSFLSLTSLLCVAAVLLSGCLKDDCRNTYQIYTPVYKTLTQVRSEMRSMAPKPLVETGKLYVFGNYVFVNELRKGIHVIDNTNPAAPRNLSFISIPGNVDIAVKGNYLYADCYSDVVVMDISNPQNVQPVRFLDNVIPENGGFWGNVSTADSVNIVVDYIVRDTTVDCNTWSRWGGCAACSFLDAGGRPTFASAASAAPTGTGGSMARFTITADHLYGVSGSRMHVFNLGNAAQPQKVNTVNLGWGIETIYPFKDRLFIGSNTGMFIYSISNPATPVQQGTFSHATVCDPVIADDNYAYVTLRSGTACRGFTNQLDVLNITNVNAPTLIKTYQLTNPHGLSKDGNTLFICDGRDGVRVYDASNPSGITEIKQFSGLDAFDVIAMNGKAIVVAKDGLYQYDYSNRNDIRLLSKIGIQK
jgi:hypothetical protein